MIIRLKIWFAARKAKKYWLYSLKDNERYNLQFRTDFIVKKITSLMKSLNIEIVVKGYDNLSSTGPCFLYGNHQDNFDALALLYALKAKTEAKDDLNKMATFIAKHSLQYKSWLKFSYWRFTISCSFWKNDTICFIFFDKFSKVLISL